MSDEQTTPAAGDPAAAAPKIDIRVEKGEPTDDEIAALIAVLGSAAGGGGAAAEPAERNMWGHPVDRLRYPIFSWQRITLQERTHMRR